MRDTPPTLNVEHVCIINITSAFFASRTGSRHCALKGFDVNRREHRLIDGVLEDLAADGSLEAVRMVNRPQVGEPIHIEIAFGLQELHPLLQHESNMMNGNTKNTMLEVGPLIQK